MNTMFVLAQIMSCAALIISIIGFQQKKKSKILLFTIISNIPLLLSYVFLQAYPALPLMILASIRTIVFYILDIKKNTNKNLSLVIFIIFETLLVVSSLLVWDGWLSFVLLSGYIFYTYGCWQKKRSILLIANIILSLILIIYNIFIGGYINIIMETILMISAIYPLIKLISKKENNN